MKNELFERHDLKHALKSPPHITLHMPFRLKPKKLEELKSVLSSVANESQHITLELNGFRHFNERVLYVFVEPEDELTKLFYQMKRQLRRALNIDNADYKNRGFNAHITLAFRDMKKSAFREIWPEFEKRDYHKQFTARDFTLFVHQNGKWETEKVYQLGS